MYEQKLAIEDTLKFISALPIRDNGYPIEEIFPVVQWINLRLDFERDFGVGSQTEQFEWFSLLVTIGRAKPTGGTQSLGHFMLTKWAESTTNLYGIAYHKGHQDGHITGSFFATKKAVIKAETMAVRAKKALSHRATSRRRLIGATSREKVKNAAQPFMHLSKANASYEMANVVNLDPGTIKRYLTKLFPGDQWKQ